MMSGLLVTLLMLLLGACVPLGHVAAGKNGIAEYAWAGCHVVKETPRNGAYAIEPLGDLGVGDKFYFKQASLDGTVSPVVTGKPC